MKTFKNALLLMVLVFIVGNAISGLEKNLPLSLITNYKEFMSKAFQYTVKVSTKEGDVIKLDLEEYLIGVVAGEMPASFDMEALKAQAVASRTFALSRNLVVDTTTNTQVYLDNETLKRNWQDNYEVNYNKIKEAVDATRGEVLTYNNNLISAVFFSCSNGSTENNNNYFNVGEIPYLRAVSSPWDESVALNFIVDKTFTKQELLNAFEVDTIDIKITSLYDSGRVETVKVNDMNYTGREIREKLGLRSSDFRISIDNDVYTFTTTGSGHGVGMSQYGAQGMALSDYKYQEILFHYYKDVKLEKK